MGYETDDSLKLYIRLPVKIEEELQIKNLHPSIKRVQLPRQKSRRWCIVHFESTKDLEDFKKDIEKREINNKRIIIGPFKRNGRTKKISNSASIVPPTELLVKTEEK